MALCYLDINLWYGILVQDCNAHKLFECGKFTINGRQYLRSANVLWGVKQLLKRMVLSAFALMSSTLVYIMPTVYAQAYTNSRSPKLTFSVISDIHIRSGKSDWGKPYRDAQAEKNFTQALSDLHEINPNQNALVLNGDLTATGMSGDYNAFKTILGASYHPYNLLFSIGNHEFYAAYHTKNDVFNKKSFPNGVTESACIQRFIENTGVPGVYYDRWIQGYHFIILGTEQSAISNRSRGDDAFLSQTQLTWLQNKLNEHFSLGPTFVFLHQPLPHTVTGSDGNDVIQSDELKRILKAHPQVILFSGHSHRSFTGAHKTVYQDGFATVNDASVRSCTNARNYPTRESQGIYVEVYDDKVIVRERDFKHRSWLGKHIIPVHMLPRFPSSANAVHPPLLNEIIAQQ